MTDRDFEAPLPLAQVVPIGTSGALQDEVDRTFDQNTDKNLGDAGAEYEAEFDEAWSAFDGVRGRSGISGESRARTRLRPCA